MSTTRFFIARLLFAAAFSIATIACASGVSVAVAQDAAAIKQKYGKSIFRISVQITNESGVSLPEQSGTGFIVSADGHLLTAAHVLFSDIESPGQKVTRSIYAHARDFSAAKVLVDVVGAPDRDLDLALLRLSIVSTEAIPCWNFDANVVEGAPLLGLGYPGNQPLIPATGSFASRLGGQGRWLATLPAARGHSGSPIFEGQGGVVGMIRGGHSTLNQLIEFVPGNYVRGYLGRFGIAPRACPRELPKPPTAPDPPKLPEPEPTTCWNHNGSTMKLLAEGTTRRILYMDVREGMREYANPGDLVFQGRQVADQWSGVAYVFTRGQRCGRLGYNVTGRSQGPNTFVLNGLAPTGAAANCAPIGKKDDTLVFTRLGRC